MKKNMLMQVPMYFEPFVNDCFTNAVSSLMQYKGWNPNILWVDYLNFMFDPKQGYVGMNYPVRPIVVEPQAEECCTSYEFIDLPPVSELSNRGNIQPVPDRITINRMVEDNPEKAYEHVKELIDSGTPAIVAVDLFYMKHHKAYQINHGLHNIVIIGYDEEEGYFELFDKYRYSGSDFAGRLPIHEVNASRMSNNPNGNILVGVDKQRPIRNLSIEMVVGDAFEISKDRVTKLIRESCTRMKGEKRILGNECGMPAFELFIDSLRNKQQEGFTEKNIFYFKEYLRDAMKQISRGRNRFKVFLKESGALNESALAQCMEQLEEASKYWDIASNLSYKMTVTKKPETMEQICGMIENIKNSELSLVEKLSKVTS